MRKIFDEVSVILRISVVILSVAVAPQVLAQDAAAKRIKELEERLQTMQNGMQAMQNGMQALQSELEKVRTESSQVTQKIEHIQQKEKENLAEEEQGGRKGNMVFCRGGFAHSSQHRDGLVFHSDVVNAGAQDRCAAAPVDLRRRRRRTDSRATDGGSRQSRIGRCTHR